MDFAFKRNLTETLIPTYNGPWIWVHVTLHHFQEVKMASSLASGQAFGETVWNRISPCHLFFLFFRMDNTLVSFVKHLEFLRWKTITVKKNSIALLLKWKQRNVYRVMNGFISGKTEVECFFFLECHEISSDKRISESESKDCLNFKPIEVFFWAHSWLW